MRRNGLSSLLFIVVLTVVGLGLTLAAGNAPLLGLDLQGGVSVVYEPAEPVSDEALSQTIEIIRRRVDALGVAEPEIGRQGDAIVVQLPGVKDPDVALAVIGQTAELRFRPVLETVPILPDSTTTSTLEGETTTTVAGDTTSSTTVAGSDTTETTDTTVPDEVTAESLGIELTAPEDDVADAEVILDSIEGERLRLGPTLLTGEALSTAEARLSGQTGGVWTVNMTMRGGADGIDAFNEAATACFDRTPTCPSGRLAITLDGEVQSAPTIQTPTFERDAIQISGSFTESEAKDLALVLKFGALPVELVPQQTQAVSATLGKDALDAGIISGIVGLLLVAIYMIAYYRLLGVVAMLSLALSGSLLWVVISYLGENRGLALTLAGVTGIIVSIGVAVDSNVVFYEHLKEDVSRGRTLRSSVDGSFASAFSTIVKADIASLIGAAVLWSLTVGPVRGFAFYLGLSTLLDLVASYFFMRPLTVMLAKSPRFADRNRWFGLPAPPEAEPEAVPA